MRKACRSCLRPRQRTRFDDAVNTPAMPVRLAPYSPKHISRMNECPFGLADFQLLLLVSTRFTQIVRTMISPFLNKRRSATFQSLIFASALSIPGCQEIRQALSMLQNTHLTPSHCGRQDLPDGRYLLLIWVIFRCTVQ